MKADDGDLALRRARLDAGQQARLAARLRGVAPLQRPAPTPVHIARPERAPLSPAQQGLWLLWQLDPSDSAYHLNALLTFEGRVNAIALVASLHAIVARHEALRSVVEQGDDGLPLQRVLPASAECLDHAQLEATDGLVGRVLAQQLLDQPFDLTRGPLLRTRLILLDDCEGRAPARWQLAIVMHHIASDAWSKRLILGEFVTEYAARSQGRVPAPQVAAPPYTQHALAQLSWLAGPERPRLLEQALAALSEAPERPERLFAPDRPSSAAKGRAGLNTLWIEAPLVAVLQARAQGLGTSLFNVLLCGWLMLLQRASGQTDLRLGLPVANRHKGEVENVVGCFVNTTLLQCRLDPLAPLSEVLQRCRDAALAAQARQDLPLELLVDALAAREGRRLPFQVMFNHLREQHEALAELPGLHLLGYEALDTAPQCELLLDSCELPDGRVRANFFYDERCFTAVRVADLAAAYVQALRALVESPSLPLHQLDLRQAAERDRVAGWSRNEERLVDLAAHAFRPLHELIAERAAQDPEAIALVCATRALSRAELERRAECLAGVLQRRGIGREVRVGIVMRRSVEMVVALLAVLKCGAAYVPIDPDYPAERLSYLIDDAKLSLLLTHGGDTLALDPGLEKMEVCEAVMAADVDFKPRSTHPEQQAYVIYTSGSTGRPKGASNRHGALLNRLVWMQQAYGLGVQDAVLQKTPFGFDVSVWEFFWPLLSGARLVMADPGDHRDPRRLQELVEAHGVTVVHFVPSMLQAFLLHLSTAAQAGACASLRLIVCSGEALPAELAQRCLVLLPGAQLVNLYGPTEAAIDVTQWTCRPGDVGPVPIGVPIAGLQTRILDAQLDEVPEGVAGELYLGGLGLARGYLGRAALTAACFVADPFDADGGRLYRTGDLARWRADGCIEYLGRLDHQIKLRGQRIELGEIENELLQAPEVEAAVVVLHAGAVGPMLAAYVLPAPAAHIDVVILRERLSRRLPEVMLPSSISVLETLPLSPNGKLDRRALPPPEPPPAALTEAPLGAVEQEVAHVWAQLLQRAPGRHEDFFALGGHSLLASQLLAQLQQRLPGAASLSLADLFRVSTVAGQAALISPAGEGNGVAAWSDLADFLDAIENPVLDRGQQPELPKQLEKGAMAPHK